ncbi:cyclic pyranopterin monophosphate synthase isoform X2 [Tribolium madens]|uniref:cyclic pyranopterin monophosphate synthase isoform X2 n=1 Tax=Tribolium madens TaxID=41895 RepID=UPI001CF722BC|nr:cyclic pyranopterin monophosphate synthase isoform X2 [Tribolium madens]
MFRLHTINLVKKKCRQLSIEAVQNKGKIKVNDQVESPLTDLFGRNHTYLRISLSERCNLRSPIFARNYSTKLSHVTSEGKATMVDITPKPDSVRTAKARGTVRINYQTSDLIRDVTAKKGDVLTVAQLAGIMGAKKTSQLIPLCHNIAISKVEVNVKLNYERKHIEIEASVRSVGKTGVEMEALTAVSVAALTVYDMCKSVSHDIVIGDISLVSKSGGKSDFGEPIVLKTLEESVKDTEIRVGAI